jgi:hypothetical protein
VNTFKPIENKGMIVRAVPAVSFQYALRKQVGGRAVAQAVSH